MNKSNPGIRRIMADVRELEKHPSYRYSARPLEDNMFEWHFTIRGPVGSDFEGGLYHGRILLPPQYPFKPPNIVFLTQNGRFEVGTKICLSISAYHEESWQPAWGIRTMLEAIISFLPSEGGGAIGALDWSKEERQRLAKASRTWVCSTCECCISELVTEPTDEDLAAEKEEGGGSAKLPSEMNDAISQVAMGAEDGGDNEEEAKAPAASSGEGEEEGESGASAKEGSEESAVNEVRAEEETDDDGTKSVDMTYDEELTSSTWREAESARKDPRVQNEDDGGPASVKETVSDAAAESDSSSRSEIEASVATPRGPNADSGASGSPPASSIATPAPAPAPLPAPVPAEPVTVETPPSILAIRRRILASRAEERASAGQGEMPTQGRDGGDRSAVAEASGDGNQLHPSSYAAPSVLPAASSGAGNDSHGSEDADSGAGAGAGTGVEEALAAIATAVPATAAATTQVAGSGGPLLTPVEAVNIRASQRRGVLTPQSAGFEAAMLREQARGEVNASDREQTKEWLGHFLNGIMLVLLVCVVALISMQLLKILDGTLMEEFQPKYQRNWRAPSWQPPKET